MKEFWKVTFWLILCLVDKELKYTPLDKSNKNLKDNISYKYFKNDYFLLVPSHTHTHIHKDIKGLKKSNAQCLYHTSLPITAMCCPSCVCHHWTEVKGAKIKLKIKKLHAVQYASMHTHYKFNYLLII